MNSRDNPNYYFTDRLYKPKLICFDCRKVFKRRLAVDLNIDKEENWNEMVCPDCGKKADYVGPKFRAPKSDNIKAWKSIEVLKSIGVLTFIGFGSDRINIPKSNKGLTDLLVDLKADYENTVRRYISLEFNDENKLQIKAFSDRIKRIDKYLNKK